MTTMQRTKAKAPDPLVGRLVAGRFQVLERIATGGMGVVYKAEQIPLGRVVALKVLEKKHVPDLDETFRQRFFLEAAAAAQLSHPNTVVVFDYGQADDGMYYLAMEYLSGSTLDQHLKQRGPLMPPHAIHLSLQICSSLRDAHFSGLVHRDLKPGNVMFAPRAGDPWFVKVLDFGLVKVASGQDKEDLGLTQSGVVMGSPRYMAPEQVRALPIDHRADIYSFGATLYHMLTGAPPFAGGKSFDAMTAHVTTPPPPLRETLPDCVAGPRLEELVMRCLEKSPDDRFASMDELMGELHACAQEAGSTLSSGSSYLSNPGFALTGTDSNPSHPSMRFADSPSRSSWSGGHTAPTISGQHLIRQNPNNPDDIHVDVALESSRPKKKPLLPMFLVGGFVGVGAIVGLIVIAVAIFSPSDDVESDPVSDARGAMPSAIENNAPASVPDPVRVVTDPPGATLRHAGNDLGDTPLMVPVPTGERWEVDLVLEGYMVRRVTLLGGQPEITVRLRRGAEMATAEEETDVGDPSAPGARNSRSRWRPGRPVTQAEQAAPVETAPVEPTPPSPDRERRERREPEQAESNNADLHDPWNTEE